MSILLNRNNYTIISICLLITASSCNLFKKTSKYQFPDVNTSYFQGVDSATINNKDFTTTILTPNSSNGTLCLIETISFGFGTEIYGDHFNQLLSYNSPDVETFKNFKSVSLFPKSQFEIDSIVKPIALKTFTPLLDSILKESKNTGSNHLIVQIVICGYTDGMGTSENSALYQSLKKYMKKVPMTKQNINKQLSYMRAVEVGKIISEVISNQKESFEIYDKVYIQLLNIGKGEEMPDHKKKYKQNDEKRRIVKVYWNILEDE